MAKSVKEEAIALRQNIDKVHKTGLEEGYLEGQLDGYSNGYETGYNKGHSDGYSEGEENGYGYGYDSGMVDGRQAEYDEFWDSFQENGNKRIYRFAFAGTSWNSNTFKPKYKIKCGSGYFGAQGMFNYFNAAITAPPLVDMSPFDIDFSDCDCLPSTFQNARLKNLYCDISKVTGNAQHAFATIDGGWLENITIRAAEGNSIPFAYIFQNATYLMSVFFTDDSVIYGNINLSSSPISAESAISVINALKDYSGTDKEFTYTVSFSSKTKGYLDALGNTAPDGLTWLEYAKAKGWNV